MKKTISTVLRASQQAVTMNALAHRFKFNASEEWLASASLSPINGGDKEAKLLLSIRKEGHELPVIVTVKRDGGGRINLSIQDKSSALQNNNKVSAEKIFNILGVIFKDPDAEKIEGRGGLLRIGSEDRLIGYEDPESAVTDNNGVLENANGERIAVQK